MRTVTCACGAVIPSRHVPDYYRLTPNAAEIRRQRGWGRQASRIKQFMDKAEAMTRQGQTIIQFRPPPGPAGPALNIMRHCQRIGYLEYVCPHCERTLTSRRKEFLMPPALHEAGTRLAVRFLKNIRHRTERMALEHVRAPFSWHEGRVQDLCVDIDACLNFLVPADSSMTATLYELTRVPCTAAAKAQALRAEYFTELREAVQGAVELYDESEP